MGKPPQEQKEEVFQAVLLADNFNSSIFGPIWAEKRYPFKNAFDDDDEDGSGSEQEESPSGNGNGTQTIIDMKLSQESLIPLANRKLLDYSLEALTISGVQEIFIYCSSGVKGGHAIKDHIKKSRWSDLAVKINVISSEDCQSFGDALRDLDAKGMIRNDFILMASGVITNTALKPLLEEHKKTNKLDKGAVMTLVHRKVPFGHRSRSAKENPAIVADSNTGKIITYANQLQGKRLGIPVDNLKTEMDVVLDTVDTGIAVCSSSVLPLFTDNFDFANMADFVKNILMNEEVMGNTIYLNQLKSGYAARIVDFDTYMGVGMDVMQRWSYPLVPDMPFGSNPGESVCGMGLNFVYKVSNVRTARESKIGPAVVIGNGTVIGKSVIVQASSIGKNCCIGQEITITNCQIGNNVIIEDGCKLENSVILDGTKITTSQKIPLLSLVVGNQVFEIQNPFDDQEDESDSDGGDEQNDGNLELDETDDEDHQDRDLKRFCEEVLESLHRGFTDNVELDNLFVEIQGSRTANFMYFDDAVKAVILAILELPTKLNHDFLSIALKAQWEKSKEVVVKFKDLLIKFVKNEAAQSILLETIEEYANDNAYFRPMVMQLLHYFYDEEILVQELILVWYKKKSLYQAGEEIRKLISKFIEWLETASEESDSEEDDDD